MRDVPGNCRRRPVHSGVPALAEIVNDFGERDPASLAHPTSTAVILVCRRSPKSSSTLESVTRRAWHTLHLGMVPVAVGCVMFLATVVAGQCILVCRRSPKSSTTLESVTRRAWHTSTSTSACIARSQPRFVSVGSARRLDTMPGTRPTGSVDTMVARQSFLHRRGAGGGRTSGY